MGRSRERGPQMHRIPNNVDLRIPNNRTTQKYQRKRRQRLINDLNAQVTIGRMHGVPGQVPPLHMLSASLQPSYLVKVKRSCFNTGGVARRTQNSNIWFVDISCVVTCLQCIYMICALYGPLFEPKDQGSSSSSSSESSSPPSTMPTSNSQQTSHLEPGAAAETYLTNRSTPSSRRTRSRQLKCGCQVNRVSSSSSSSSSTSSLTAFEADALLDSGRSFAGDCLLDPERYTAGSSSSSSGAM